VRLDAACTPTFARHETFHPRYGWVKKAVEAATEDPHLFNDEEAVVRLGVGKNMVRSIRFWGMAFKVLSTYKAPGSRVPESVPSVIGRTMFGEGGWDPYAEHLGTHWLLHWWLLAPPSSVPVWWLAFNEFPGVEFNEEQLEQFVTDRVRDWGPHPSSVKKDVACMLRMYADGQSSRAGFDDLLDCPTRELRLVTPAAEKDTFRFMIGGRPTLPPAVAAFACLDFVARTDSSAQTVTISRLATEPGAPGRALKLSESALLELLELAAQDHEEIEVGSSAGIPQLSFRDDPADAGSELLRDHYRALTGTSHLLFPGTARICGPGGSEPARAAADRDTVAVHA
jgi:hypothetical protein